jgi:hypothetical protein
MPEPHILFTVVQPAASGSPAPRRLPRRGLPLAGGQHAAHDDLIDLHRRQPGALDGGLDGDAADLGAGERSEVAHEAAHGRAGGGNDDDGIGGFCRHGASFQISVESAAS